LLYSKKVDKASDGYINRTQPNEVSKVWLAKRTGAAAADLRIQYKSA